MIIKNYYNLFQNKAFISHPFDFNDLFDGGIKLDALKRDDNFYNKLVEDYKNRWYKNKDENIDFDKNFLNLSLSNKILSLSSLSPSEHESITQWAHYASNHCGYATEWELEELIYLLSLQIDLVRGLSIDKELNYLNLKLYIANQQINTQLNRQ